MEVVVGTRSRVGPCGMAVTVGADFVEQALQISAERNNNPPFVWNQQADLPLSRLCKINRQIYLFPFVWNQQAD